MSKNETTLNPEERKILKTIARALPYMREFDKGYLLAMGESMATRKKEAKSRTAC